MLSARTEYKHLQCALFHDDFTTVHDVQTLSGLADALSGQIVEIAVHLLAVLNGLDGSCLTEADVQVAGFADNLQVCYS